MLYIVLIVVGFYLMGLVDRTIELYKQTDEYDDIMDNYYQDVRRIQKL
jgi:hypothetical protein